MKDNRIKTLASLLLGHAVKLKPGENLLIEITDSGEEMAVELIRQAYALGANPFIQYTNQRIQREWIAGANLDQVRRQASYDIPRMKDMDACISIRGTINLSEFHGIPAANHSIYQAEYLKPINMDLRLNTTKWNVIRWPTAVMANKSGMSMEEFEDYYFRVCCLDYVDLAARMEHLGKRMSRTDKVRLVGKGTDLTFSIKGQPPVISDGINNIPDGEVSCGPIRDSANGIITYNTSSDYGGYTHNNVMFELKDGRIINADSSNKEKTNAILDTDSGSRYIGEFAIGIHPYITRPIGDTLFDEKATGSIHFTPGNAYASSFNGNRSAVHWDLVLMQTPEYGGGEIWFDDELIRKDGIFIPEDLKCLNPDHFEPFE